jgi:hypothetical protein
MALQSSGIITMNDIRAELGIPSQSPFSLNDAVNSIYVTINTCSPSYPSTTPPYELSDWYGYDHNYICCTCKYVTFYIDQTDLDNANSNTDPSLDGKVFWDYNQCCSAGNTTTSFTSNGTYTDYLCACEENGTAGLYYYYSDIIYYVINSTITYTSNCNPC